LETSIENIQKAKDAEAKLLLSGLCAMSVGSKNRLERPDYKAHVEALCGGK
jgi:hypothetical protein